jgi:hypothetical protein
MKKCTVLTLMLVTVIATGLFIAGCSQRDSRANDYYPLGVGSFWEYNVLSYGEGGMTKMSKEIVKVIDTERVGETESYVIDRYSIEGSAPSISQYREYLTKLDTGIECTKRSFPMLAQAKSLYPGIQSDIVHTPTELRFKTNPKEGDSWDWSGVVTLVLAQDKPQGNNDNNTMQPPPTIRQIKGKMEYKFLGFEKVKVMGQEFNCQKLSVFGKSDSELGQELESEIWYAPGIGRVREEQIFYEGSKKVQHVFELVAYNIINKRPFQKR